MINNEELIKDISVIFDKRIVLYGASGTGVRSLHQLMMAGFQVDAFADGDAAKWGTYVFGKKVLSPKELSELDKNRDDVVILISSVYENEISKMLDELQIGKGRTFSMRAFIYALNSQENADKIKTLPNSKYGDDMLRLDEVLFKMWFCKRTYLSYDDLRKLLFHDNPVLIFQAGKVGSTTIFHSLEKKMRNVIHCHSIEWFLQFHHKGRPVLINEEEYQCIRNGIRRKEGLKIISAVREPIDRDLSSYFQELTGTVYHERVAKAFRDDKISEDCLRHLNMLTNTKHKKRFKAYKSSGEYVCNHIKYGYLFDWFDLEIKPLFGIDVYDYPFDKEKGYTIIKKDNIELLVYRLENLNGLETVIGDFVGCKDFQLEADNEGSKKVYAPLYQEIRKNIQLPPSYVDFYYKGNPRMDHFYTEEEKMRFLKKWKNNIQ